MNEEVEKPKPAAEAPQLMRHQFTSGRYALNETDIGVMVEDSGILLAPAFQYVNNQGQPVGPFFDCFVAPADTRVLAHSERLATYGSEIDRIAHLINVCGYSGGYLDSEWSIHDSAEDPRAWGSLRHWNMPPLSLVNGCDTAGNLINPNNMYAHRNKGALAGTFNDQRGAAGPDWRYWTATGHFNKASIAYTVDFTTGGGVWAFKDQDILSSRAVRMEARPGM